MGLRAREDEIGRGLPGADDLGTDACIARLQGAIRVLAAAADSP